MQRQPIFVIAALCFGCGVAMSPYPAQAPAVAPNQAVLISKNVEIQSAAARLVLVPGGAATVPHICWSNPLASQVLASEVAPLSLPGTGITFMQRLGSSYYINMVVPGSPADAQGLLGKGVHRFSHSGGEVVSGSQGYADVFRLIMTPGSVTLRGTPAPGPLQIESHPCGIDVTVRSLAAGRAYFGRLAFYPVHSSAPTIARVYRIEVPEHKFAEANGGLISVVYEPYTAKLQNLSELGKPMEVSQDLVAWALWISDLPLQSHLPTGGALPPPTVAPAAAPAVVPAATPAAPAAPGVAPAAPLAATPPPAAAAPEQQVAPPSPVPGYEGAPPPPPPPGYVPPPPANTAAPAPPRPSP